MQIYMPFAKISSLSDQGDLDNLYKQMENMGVNRKPEEKPEAAVTKLDAVRFVIRAAGYDGAATLELVTHYIDAPSRYARLALERAKELMV
jgi:hypothetical protein